MKKKAIVRLFLATLASTLLACGGQNSVRSDVDQEALNRIDVEDLETHVRTLASDEFEGRLPGSRGEERTIDYLAGQFKSLALRPGNPNGTFFQEVPLVGITADPDMELTLTGGRSELTLDYGTQFMAWTKRVVEQTGIEGSELIFAGYGVQAPEFDWDDFKDVDLTDKTLVVLVNDPPVPDSEDPSQLDEDVFGGRAMTYYGRWTYKFEVAARKGAAACLIIHETQPAGYPWEVVSGSWRGEQFDLMTPDKNMSRCAVEGWLTYETARELFQQVGHDLEELKKAAVDRDFQPVPLGMESSASIRNKIRTVSSNNVIASLEGSDPERAQEWVIYTAHWDHLGQDPSLQGDQIYNGALDNATGTAGLLELAEAFKSLETPPRRSVLFLAVTAEEQGLLGSKYYAENPLHPLTKTVAVINMDAMNIWGETKDVTLIGMGHTTLDNQVIAAASAQGRVVRPDPEPEKGYYYRSDHFSFAKQGVPAIYLDPGVEFVDRPEGWGLKQRAEYTEKRYHKPADEYDSNWDLGGLVQDLRLLFRVGYAVANQDEYPRWEPGTEFKARREQMLEEAGISPERTY